MYLTKDREFMSTKVSMGGGKTHMLIMDKRLTTFAEPYSSTFLFADNPSEFRSRLSRHLVVPTHESWNDFLWRAGLAESLITTCVGFGTLVYTVRTPRDRWLAIIKKGLSSGEIR